VLGAAFAQAEAQAAAGHPVLLVSGDGWHPGVVGIVAGRIKEKFNRPACVAGIAAGLAKGSGRSIAGLDLGSAVIAARQAGLLETGGGHAMAAGFSYQVGRQAALHDFLDARLALASGLPGAADLVVEGSIAVPAATSALAQQVERLAPFGAGNEEPVFALARARVVRADRVGKEAATVRAYLEGEAGGRLKAICFRAKEGPLAEALLNRRSEPLHLCGQLRAERWNDEVTACLHVVDAALPG
jgi:single-stranded-DNA-specific exonuclease